MRLGFVVQRYGEEVLGGAESLARQVAERLVSGYPVEVLTTCALEYTTWANHYPPGVTRLNDITVRRFPVERTRHPHFDAIYAALLENKEATIIDEINWLQDQGPYTPALLHYLREHKTDYDLLIFVGYLYFHTYFGLQIAPERSILLPTTHDEPTLGFSIYNTVFALPQGFIFMTPEEQDLALNTFPIGHKPQTVIGGEVPLPDPARVEGAAFRREYGLPGPYLLYAGRISPSKQCHVLCRWFEKLQPDVDLVFIGKLDMDLPRHPRIRYLGMLPEAAKFAAMQEAAVFLMPSFMESFSIVTLEALGMGTPVLADGRGEVVRGHCIRSNGGLYYQTYEEFAACLHLLLGQPDLARRMGQHGRAYVQQNYDSIVVRDRYLAFLAQMMQKKRW